MHFATQCAVAVLAIATVLQPVTGSRNYARGHEVVSPSQSFENETEIVVYVAALPMNVTNVVTVVNCGDVLWVNLLLCL